ncbi:MAG: hypothetical protein D6692_07905 [Planctomycetota bacterium]|nr:MAG: hypothetical protein D6692_07905 [Planctomycetota bacterium]
MTELPPDHEQARHAVGLGEVGEPAARIVRPELVSAHVYRFEPDAGVGSVRIVRHTRQPGDVLRQPER